MYDLITIGNVSIDLYFQGNSLTFEKKRFNLAIGGKYAVDHFHEGLGGGAANVAIGASKMGLKTSIMAKIGNNQFKSMILKHLKDHGICDTLCVYKDEYLKISTILLSPDGERTIINYETPHEHICENDNELEKLSQTHMVYMSNLPKVSLEERNKVMSYLNQHNILTILNLGISDCRRPTNQLIPMLKKTNILLINAHEFCEMTKYTYEAIDFKKDVRKYLDVLYDKTVIITDGEKGSYAYYDTKVHHQKAQIPHKIVDTTGAGDGYTAAFIATYFQSKDIIKAMESGSKYALKIIEKLGAN